MARNFFFGGGYNQQDPFQALAQGIMLGQNIIGNLNQAQTSGIKNEMLQNELTKQQAVKNALANYGQPEFDNAAAIKGLMQAGDPETAFKLQNLQRTMTKEQIDMMASGASLAEKLAPILLQDPSQYPVVLAKTKAAGIDIGLPEWKTFFDQQGQFNAPMYAKTIAAIGGGTKTLQDMMKPKEPHFLPPAYGPNGEIIQNVVQPGTNQVTQLPGAVGGKEFTPVKFIDKNDPTKFEWVQPGQMPKNPNAVSETVYGQLLKIPDMSEEDQKAFGKAWAIGGKDALPKIPGFMGGPLLAKIQGYGLQYLRDSGQNVNDVLANQAEYGGLAASLRKVETNYGVVGQSIKKTNYHLDHALELADKVNNTGVPVFNRWINAGRRAVTDDPDLAAFDTNVRLAASEAAKATTGNPVISDQSQREIDKILNTAQAPKAFKASAGTLKDMMQAVDKSYTDEIGRIRTGIKSIGKVNAPETPRQPIQAQPSKQAIPPKLEEQFYNQTKAGLMQKYKGPELEKKLQQLDEMRKSQRGQ